MHSDVPEHNHRVNWTAGTARRLPGTPWPAASYPERSDRKAFPEMIVWTDYLKYRAGLRGFDLVIVEKVLRFSEERYFDTVTGRQVVIGRHGGLLIMIPYEQIGDDIIPITIHATTRQQVNFRLKSGRFQK